MRLLAIGGAVQTALLTFPDRTLQYIPQWALQGLAIFSLACVILAGVGRVTTTEPHNDLQSPIPPR